MASEDGAGPYRGLLVDWGGVMTTSPLASFRSFCELEGLEPETIVRSFREDRDCRKLMIGLETGEVSEHQFEPLFAATLGVPASGLIDRLFAGTRPEEEMLAALRRARQAGIRTGLISNSWGTRRYPRPLLAQLFDGTVISGEVGIRKPAPGIYELGANSIDTEPAQCVFVDDLPFNLEPAAQLGMATVHHLTPEQTIAQLERLLGVRLR